jgi:putative PIN family toxin of toxin-antitoxin system
LKIFLDTNVLASGIATRGLCSELLESVIHDHELLTCQPVLRELERVLTEKLRLPKAVVAGFLALLKAEGSVVESRKNPSIPILACAIAGKADVFVTGDKELLNLLKLKT